jgi:hypothetical protein
MLRAAAERQSEIIGYAFAGLRRADPALAATIPDLSHIVAFRNVLVRGYTTVDDRPVRGVVERGLSALREAVAQPLGEGGGDLDGPTTATPCGAAVPLRGRLRHRRRPRSRTSRRRSDPAGARGRRSNRVTVQDQAAATERLRRALLAFQAALNLLLEAERRLKGLPQTEVDAFWKGQGRRVEATVRAAATEAVAAFKRFSAAGLVAGASDRHLVTQAQRYLADGAA